MPVLHGVGCITKPRGAVCLGFSNWHTQHVTRCVHLLPHVFISVPAGDDPISYEDYQHESR
jgi:hypothetical protein